MIKSPINWVGGKSKLVTTLIENIPEHKGYIEVFGGALYLFFAKEKSKWEVINDFDSNLMNFWTIVQKNPQEFINTFTYSLHSREIFNKYKNIFNSSEELDKLDDLTKAHIFYYLNNACFGADMTYPCFGTNKGLAKFNSLAVENKIKLAHDRLNRVTIENDDFRKIIKRYDSKDSFFYLDPPYYKAKKYRVQFTDEDYIDLLDLCKNMKGKFLISINNDPFIYDLFKIFNIQEIDVQYSVSRNNLGRRKFNELLVKNF